MGRIVVTVPRTKLWKKEDGHWIVLECECGTAVPYPGHPDSQRESLCPTCGVSYRVQR